MNGDPKGRPIKEGLRWSLQTAAVEFGLDRQTLKKRLIQESIEPGDDDHYSTPQITRVVFGDIEAEKLRKAKADADKAEIDAAARAEQVILRSEADALWEEMGLKVLAALRKEVPEPLQSKLIKTISALKLRT